MKFKALRPANLLKSDSSKGYSCEFCEDYKNIYFVEHLQIATSELVKY